LGIDDIEIKEIADLSGYLAEIDYEQAIFVETDKDTYNLKLRFNEEEGRYLMGISGVRTAFCARTML
jgi:hypothetical protein